MTLVFTERESTSREYLFERFSIDAKYLGNWEVSRSDNVAVFDLSAATDGRTADFISIAADLYDPLLHVFFDGNTIDIAVTATPAGRTPLEPVRVQVSYTEEEARTFARAAFPKKFMFAPLRLKVLGASLEFGKRPEI